MNKRRVAITGIGAITGFGVGADLLVDKIFAGRIVHPQHRALRPCAV